MTTTVAPFGSQPFGSMAQTNGTFMPAAATTPIPMNVDEDPGQPAAPAQSAPSMPSNHRSGSAGIEKVLDATLLTVCSFLDTREICVISRVSAAWRRLVAQPELWRQIDLSRCSPHAVTDAVAVQLFRAHPSISVCNLRFCTKIGASTIEAATIFLKDLVDLNLEGCTRSIDDAALSVLRCPKLKRLVLDGCQKLTAAALLRLIQTHPQLEALSLNGVPAVTDHFLAALADTAVSSVRVNGCAQVTDLGIAALASRTQGRLTQLHVAYCGQVSDRSLEVLAQRCVNLEDLNVYGLSITDRGLATLARLSNLRILDLSMCRKLTDAGVKAMLASGRSALRSINFYDIPGISSASVAAVADTCPALEFFGGYGLDDVTPQSVQYLLSTAHKLRRVDFGGNLKVSRADLQVLSQQFPRVTFC